MTSPTTHARTSRIGRIASATLAVLAIGGLAACTSTAAPGEAAGNIEGPAAVESPFDLSSANVESRPRIDPIPEAVAAL